MPVSLQIRDVFATPSLRWDDPRAHLPDGKAWEAISEDALASLSLTDPVGAHLDAKLPALDAVEADGRPARRSLQPLEPLRLRRRPLPMTTTSSTTAE
ncbi:hypothetical protein [Streptosporangium sandarakinum]|uniref:hypothetical protein n=1 Tax=Streptosporangium sandarakinum TaxID=1260955 RepID=UPI00342EB0D0